MQTQQFDAHARVEDRHWWFTARRRILTTLLRKVASPGSPVADIGCGTGGNAAAFRDAGFRTIGIDVSTVAITHARTRFPDIEFRVEDDPRKLDDHLAEGGVAVLSDVAEHVEDDRELVARVMESLPVGGHLLITVPADPALWSRHDEVFGHYRRYTMASFRDLWRNGRLEERLISHYNSRMLPLVRTYRRLSGLSSCRDGGDLDVPVGPFNGLLRSGFAGEARRLVDEIDSGRQPFRRGVSLIALLRRI